MSAISETIVESITEKLTKSSITETDKLPFTVIVEGNVACGKSTFLDYFSKNVYCKVYPEPIDKWMNLDSFNLLESAYNEPAKWASSFQSYVLSTMAEIHNQKQQEPIKIMERSIYSAHYCFEKNLFKTGKISNVDNSIHRELFNFFTKYTNTKVDLCVYLKTEPEVAFEHVKTRGRPQEEPITLYDLRNLHSLYEDWLIRGNPSSPDCQIVVYNMGNDFTLMQTYYDAIVKKIGDCRINI